MGTPTSRDVARLAGVSQSTVSYVLSGKRPISPETRERVEAAIAELTFHPNAGARALAGQRSRVVALVAPFGASPHRRGLLPFIETVAAAVREHDHDLLLVTADEGAAGLERVVGRRIVDALVLMEVEGRDERLPVAAGLGVPVVVVGLPDEPGGLHCVDGDFTAAGALAVDELARAGCERVVVLGFAPVTVERDLSYVRRFHDGARRGAEQHDLALELDPPLEPGRAGAAAAVERALDPPAGAAAAGRRTGVVVSHGQALGPVLRALADRGLDPGRDVPLVALCSDDDAEAHDPPVTSIALDAATVSRRAVAEVFRQLDVGDAPAGAAAPSSSPDLVAPRLARRATTDPVPRGGTRSE